MKCIFCGQPAGFFKREHPQCRKAAEIGKKYLRECIDYIYSNRDCLNIIEVVTDTVAKFNIPPKMVQKLFLECWEDKVADAFMDGKIDDNEIKILKEMLIALNIDNKKLAKSKQWQKLIDYGKKEITACLDAAIREKNLSNIKEQLDGLADSYGLSQVAMKQCAVEYWTHFLDKVFEDGILDEDEERLLNQLANIFMFVIVPNFVKHNYSFRRK